MTTRATGDIKRTPVVHPGVLVITTVLLLTGHAWADVYPGINNQAVYIHVHGIDTPTLEEVPGRLEEVDTNIDQLGKFWAENSGGQVSFRFQYLFDAAIVLGATGRRPENWRDQVHQVILDTYDFDLDDFDGMRAYDVANTRKDKDQEWTGQSIGKWNSVILQSRSFLVLAHETGHQLGFGHAHGFVSSDPTYIWNSYWQQYVQYDAEMHGYVSMPYAIEDQVYGHYDSVMGNHRAGHVSTKMKRQRQWLMSTTHAAINLEDPPLSERHDNALLLTLHAHDTLTAITKPDNQGFPVYGVTESYDHSRLYSLSFLRSIQVYDDQARQFVPDIQEVDVEYRYNSEYRGLFFSLNDALADVNESGSIWHLPADKGNQLDEFELGTSFYVGDDHTFVYSYPPAPPLPETVRPARYLFEIVDINDTEGHRSLELSIRFVSVDEMPAPAIPRIIQGGPPPPGRRRAQ
jgi:hypothetical protein